MKNFQKGRGHELGVKICDFRRGSQKKKNAKKVLRFLQQCLNFKTFIWLSFGLKDLF